MTLYRVLLQRTLHSDPLAMAVRRPRRRHLSPAFPEDGRLPANGCRFGTNYGWPSVARQIRLRAGGHAKQRRPIIRRNAGQQDAISTFGPEWTGQRQHVYVGSLRSSGLVASSGTRGSTGNLLNDDRLVRRTMLPLLRVEFVVSERNDGVREEKFPD
ncbi:hypothetical protein VTN96DRAFT_4146 [Rasamsonia emersonii]